MSTATALSNVSNDGKSVIETGLPYIANIRIEGTTAMLFHRWSVDGVEAKSKAAKGSKAKKEDDIESYLYRNADGFICLPGEYLRMAIIGAAKFRQDPRSPRKSAMDLFKAGIVCMDELASLGVKMPDYIDRRRVTIQRSGITRCRPAISAGWVATIPIMVNLPEYISPQLLHEVVTMAGKLIGVADFRPTFGRFSVTAFDLSKS